ncbi:Polysaccharide deacetylase [Friedmanniella luteola]|uniref:Polysaccharide deacetylase n=1 Tax=Friedmanniella luteola TaxID=546871 RepID=A0A1H1ULL8_9ACTN|nr:polysaccharide deacetylase family protein [Friedmanniella luteola]SDS73191.1 Polysaccharide deacetylase [Friedmanniella luteola]
MNAPDTTSATAGLSAVVLNHDARGIGVPMLLHTDASLGPAPAADRFSTDGYLHQSALGERLFETGDLGGERTGAHLLALNFHEVPAESRRTAAERVRRMLDLGEPYDPDGTGTGPQIALAFYDGDAGTALWAAELCSRLDVRAWFYPLRWTSLEDGPRVTDEQLADIATAHELAFHTATHRSAVEISPETVASEVTEVVDRLTRAAGRPPRLGAWRGGARYDAAELGNQAIRDLGVTHVVSNWSVERIG